MIDDKMYCTVTFTFQECSAIGAALIDYGSKKLGVKFPPELKDSNILEDFNLLKKSRKLEIYRNCFEEIMRGLHKAMLDARLEEMGNEDKEGKEYEMTGATDQRVIDNFVKLNITLERILNELERMNVRLENISDGIDSLYNSKES